MGIGGSGFAYDAMQKIARATEERRANAAYWREIRKRHQQHPPAARPPLEHASTDACIAAQLDQGIFLVSPRRCPECGNNFALINVRGVELDTCLDCGSFWLDAGEFGSLTAHEEIIAQSLSCGASPYGCPVCAAPMEQREVADLRKMKIDSCAGGHGIYLERGELAALLRDSEG
jgi:Zn-finger nucleic acid-binding protein